jgi:hypothetical protein
MLVRNLVHLLLALVAGIALAGTESSGTEAGIRDAVARYANAWLEGNPEQMGAVMAPEFMRHSVTRSAGKANTLQLHSGLAVLDEAMHGFGRVVPVDERQIDIRVLDVADDLAVAKLTIGKRVQYLQLLKWQGQWRIADSLGGGE